MEIDTAHCPNCGGEPKIIAAIMQVVPESNGPEDRLCLDQARASAPWQPVIEKILTHMGLQADCGRRSAPARDPAPQEGLALASANAACKAECGRVRQPVGHSSKRPEILQPSRFRRPSAQGRRDRLRQSFLRPRLGAKSQGETRSQSPRMTPFWAAIDLQQAAVEPKDRVSG